MALVLYSFIEGFAIPFLDSPRVGLSVHTLSAYQGVLLMTQGLLWRRDLNRDSSSFNAQRA